MKFVHTADWQLGMAFGHVQEKADALRRARIDAVKQVLALAEREKADFVIAAGDLLDDNRISPEIVEEMAKAIQSCPLKIYLLPGNHDPLTQDSPYIRCPNLFKGNAVVLGEQAPLKVEGGTLYPCPALSRKSRIDPTKWIPARSVDDGIRVGIAHGSVNIPAENDFPIDANAAANLGLDYLALGHWHGEKKINERTYYCGAPEATEFGQPDAGRALVVEISEHEAVPKIRSVSTARYKWQEISRELHSVADAEQLLKEIEALANPQTLLKLKLKGSLPPSEILKIESLNGDRFFHVKKEIDIAVADGSVDYHHPLLKNMAEILKARTAEPGEAGESARRALSKLRLYVKHAGFRDEGV